MPEQDESTTFGIGIAIGVAVLLAVIFVLILLCGLLGFVVEGAPFELGGHEAALWLAQLTLIG